MKLGVRVWQVYVAVGVCSWAGAGVGRRGQMPPSPVRQNRFDVDIFSRTCARGVPLEHLAAIVPDSAPRCAEPQSAQTAVAAATTGSTHTLPPPHLRAATSRRGNLAPRENRSASGTTPGSAGRTCVLSAAARGTGDGTASHTVSHSRRRRACPHPRRAALAQQPCRGGALALRPQPRKMAVRTYDRWPLACGAATRAGVGAQWPISGRACSRGAPRRVLLGCVAAGGRVWE